MAKIIDREDGLGFTIVSEKIVYPVKDRSGHVRYRYGIPPKPKVRHEIVDVVNPDGQVTKLMVIEKAGRKVIADENGQPLTGLPISKRR